MKYLLLDISGIIYRAFFALNKDRFHRSDGFPTNAILGTINIIKHLNKTFPDHIFVACCDSKRSQLTRMEQSEEYKQNRKEADPVLVQQFKSIYEAIQSMKIKCCKVAGYEADDLIASLCMSLSKENEVVIASSDKDMNQLLINENTKIYNPAKKQFFLAKDCEEKYSVSPEQFTFYQALVGDASDNIKGVKGIGPKTAVKLVNKYKTSSNFKENSECKYMEDFDKSLELVTLKTDIEVDRTQFTKQNLKSKEFKEFCTEMEIRA
jgi:DNA polymerase-1